MSTPLVPLIIGLAIGAIFVINDVVWLLWLKNPNRLPVAMPIATTIVLGPSIAVLGGALVIAGHSPWYPIVGALCGSAIAKTLIWVERRREFGR